MSNHKGCSYIGSIPVGVGFPNLFRLGNGIPSEKAGTLDEIGLGRGNLAPTMRTYQRIGEVVCRCAIHLSPHWGRVSALVHWYISVGFPYRSTQPTTPELMRHNALCVRRNGTPICVPYEQTALNRWGWERCLEHDALLENLGWARCPAYGCGVLGLGQS